MRTTQYIGLTKAASDFVQDLKALKSDRKTSGIAGEDIELQRWECHPMFKHAVARDRRDRKQLSCVREKVQMTPWSSGPMIFTCLEVDYGNGATTEIFQWIMDPTVKDEEFNTERGAMWV